MALSSSTWITIVVVSLVAAGIYWNSRRSRKSQGLFPKSMEPFQNATGTGAEELVGNPEVCKMMKNLLTTVSGNLTNAQARNNPAQIQLLEVSKRSIEAQIANLKCA